MNWLIWNFLIESQVHFLLFSFGFSQNLQNFLWYFYFRSWFPDENFNCRWWTNSSSALGYSWAREASAFFGLKNTNTRLIGLSILFIFIIYDCALRYCICNCNIHEIPIKIIFPPFPPICLYHLYEKRVSEPLLNWCLVVAACCSVERRQHCWMQCHC